MDERFSAYGFRMDVPNNWRIEFNSKNTRQKADVAFHSPKNNVFFVSWGNLDEARKRFKSLEEHRDESIKRIRKDPNMKKVGVSKTTKQRVSTHDGIISEVLAQKRSGLFGRNEPEHDVWSLHFYCPESVRYYVVYWHVKDAEEFPDKEEMFVGLSKTIECHQ